ncbi:hypothetical protein TRFO_20374 [Tritrichomonas foetus]|uniref:Uncharacterized protein n=1 Tax=Tritrichomonas foetus TaxID=1144522 RepID=A0A1J4KKS9_9EUKA|nr:hypothetical protein TRFO_20374 [Tritrichomonas foetus]|eukprot:OHT10404.1 hypothetical protein TRFO_20374 [Tritrichomonas foetus]
MDEVIEAAFVEKGIHYKIRLTVQQTDSFSILLIDEDQPERWEGIFTGQIISKLTDSVGSKKKVTIFWKMLQNAVLKNSHEVSYTILTQDEINELTNKSASQSSSRTSNSNMNDARFFILEQINEFDHTKFPLRLYKKPYTFDELKAIIRNLKSENNRLQSSEQSSTQRERVQALEQQIYALNGSMKKLIDEKDSVINALRRQINDLEEQARNRPKAQRTVGARKFTTNQNDSLRQNRVNRTGVSNNNSRNTPTTRKKTTTTTTTVAKSNSRFNSSNMRNSRFSSASSSAAGSRRSSAANSRNSSVASSRRSSGVNSARSSASNSRRSSANNSRPSSRNSNGSFRRFNPTEWVRNHQSGGSSRNNSRNQSPMTSYKSTKRVSSNARGGVTPTDTHLNRLHALIQNKYKNFK